MRKFFRWLFGLETSYEDFREDLIGSTKASLDEIPVVEQEDSGREYLLR